MMNICDFVADNIRKYGNTVKIWQYNEKAVSKAFVEPLRYRTQKYLGGKSLPPSYFDDGHFLYIGTPDIVFSDENALVEHRGRSYCVRRAEVYTVADRDVYTWAVLKPYFGFPEEYDESN